MTEPSFLDVFGHEELRSRIAYAVERERLPHSLLLHGPAGVGKQRLAIWTAAALNCRSGSGEPCGECRSCRLAGRLEHPDIHWFFPTPRPRRASSPEKLAEKLDDLRAEILAERRRDPGYLEDREDASGIYVSTVRTMRRLAHSAPYMGPRKVLVIGHAEALIPQRGSEQAANAVLKLLEEPPADTNLILTSDLPGALLPTIRSRVQRIRVPPLTEDRLARFLVSEHELSEEEARTLARRSGGSIGRALELWNAETAGIREAALELVRTALHGERRRRWQAAHAQGVSGARGEYSLVLRETAELLRDVLAAQLGKAEATLDPATVRELTAETSTDAERVVEILDRIQTARELAERNVNPQLITAHLLRSR